MKRGRHDLRPWAALILLLAAGASHFSRAYGQASAGAQDGTAVVYQNGEWFREGAGFVCRVPANERIPREKFKPEEMTRACLHMGPFRLGNEAQTIKSLLGEPHRVHPQPNGATSWVYFVDGPGRYPYLVATVRQSRIAALQITGPARATSREYSFNHIDLGASIDTLLKYFGPVTHVQPSTEKDTELWTYGPWPFSFEIKDGHVTSIRISDPTLQ